MATDTAYKVSNTDLPYRIRAKEHIVVSETIPAGGSITKTLRGIGNAGIVDNIQLGADVSIAYDGVEVPPALKPAGDYRMKHSDFNTGFTLGTGPKLKPKRDDLVLSFDNTTKRILRNGIRFADDLLYVGWGEHLGGTISCGHIDIYDKYMNLVSSHATDSVDAIAFNFYAANLYIGDNIIILFPYAFEGNLFDRATCTFMGKRAGWRQDFWEEQGYAVGTYDNDLAWYDPASTHYLPMPPYPVNVLEAKGNWNQTVVPRLPRTLNGYTFFQPASTRKLWRFDDVGKTGVNNGATLMVDDDLTYGWSSDGSYIYAFPTASGFDVYDFSGNKLKTVDLSSEVPGFGSAGWGLYWEMAFDLTNHRFVFHFVASPDDGKLHYAVYDSQTWELIAVLTNPASYRASAGITIDRDGWIYAATADAMYQSNVHAYDKDLNFRWEYNTALPLCQLEGLVIGMDKIWYVDFRALASGGVHMVQ